MSKAAPSQRPASPEPPPRDERLAPQETSSLPWLAVVAEKVKHMRFGVVQIVIHDSRVVQIERTERTRFDVPQAVGRDNRAPSGAAILQNAPKI